MAKKELYKLVDIDNKGRYVLEKATAVDLLMSIPNNLFYKLCNYRPILLYRLKLPNKDLWDSLEDKTKLSNK